MTTTPTPHPSNVSARPLNPDTDLPMPSPSPAQQALVAELLGTWDDAGLLAPPTANLRGTLLATLTEAVVRQHGRTTRAHIAELRGNADSYDRDARATLANTTPDGGPIDLRQLAVAEQLATGAATLRTTMLRGYSA